MRITYDKEWKRLKELDASGAEPHKIDTTRASIRALLTKINISIRSAKVISRRIHILRDDELHPHLVTLIHGYDRCNPPSTLLFTPVDLEGFNLQTIMSLNVISPVTLFIVS